MTSEYYDALDDCKNAQNALVNENKKCSTKDWADYKKIPGIQLEINHSDKKEEKVNHPPHYTWLKYACGIEVIDIARHLNFNRGNAIKYLLRSGHKSEEGYTNSEKEIEDLEKAIWYLKDEIKRLRPEKKSYTKPEIKVSSKSIRLNRKEVNSLLEGFYQNPDATEAVIEQSSTGIGLGTHVTYTRWNKTDIEKVGDKNITDYDVW